MHAKDSALCLALSHHSVDANYLRGSGKGFWVFRGKRGYFLKRDHRDFKGALASELAIKKDIEFGRVEIGGGGGHGEGHSRIEAFVPLCVPEPSLKLGPL